MSTGETSPQGLAMVVVREEEEGGRGSMGSMGSMGWDIGSSRPINNDEEGTSNNDTQEGSILGGMCYLSSMSAGVSDGSQDGSPLNRSSAMEEGEGEGEGPDSPNTSTTLIRSLEEELRVLSKEHDLAVQQGRLMCV
jgi:hypothetical protein